MQHHGKTRPLTPGALHLIPCFTPCDYFCRSPFDLYYLSFTARLAGGRDLFTLGKPDYSRPAGTEGKRLFKRLLQLNPDRALIDYDPYQPVGRVIPPKKKDLSAEDAADALESTGLLRCLLSPFLRTLRPAPVAGPPQSRRFDPVFPFIEEHLSRIIELRELAALTGMNPTYFSDLFRRTFGERPTVFINRRRIEKAQLLLLTTELQVQEIADRCGFNSTPYFTRTFHRHTGETPSRYRKGRQSF